MLPTEQRRRPIPGGGRWGVFLAVVAAIAVGFGISLLITGGDDDTSGDDTTGSSISVPAELRPAEDAAVALVEAANTGDCDAIRDLAVDRVADLLTAELNCQVPDRAVLDIVSSSFVDDDPVVVAVTVSDGDATLTIEVEMVEQGSAWLAAEFDAAS